MAGWSGDIPPIHFADSNGARIAYQYFGDGDEVVVSIPPMAQNIEMAWEQPLIRRMFERFAGIARYIIFDKHGTGSSDRTTHIPGLDARVDDLRAVMDHAGVERAHLNGNSEGGPMAILFAATYPERVKSLILNGTAATLIPESVLEILEGSPERKYQTADWWGTPESRMVARFAPSMLDDPEFCAWHVRYERASATRDSMRDLIDLMIGMDVTELLGDLDVPTLVQHRTGDQVQPVESGRALAAAIPNAEFVEYEGNDHFGYVGEDRWIDDLERWVTGTVKDRPVRSTSRARIVTLGRFVVEADGVEVTNAQWGSRLPRQICKRLVAARGWPVRREELIEQLWPDETDMRKLGSRLSVHLSAVRRVLGGGVIADRDTIRLDLHQISTDLEELMSADDDDAMVDKYTGVFLPDDQYEDWSLGARHEAASRFNAAAFRAADAAAATGDLDRAVALARRLIAVDKYDERAYEFLISALIQAGRVSEARAAHASWESAMSELDIEVAPFKGLDL